MPVIVIIDSEQKNLVRGVCIVPDVEDFTGAEARIKEAYAKSQSSDDAIAMAGLKGEWFHVVELGDLRQRYDDRDE